mmetsp:Transcript_90315/g.179721  ORF Transcript_90315/g.179721 Transcript_90315/m.179721 type:complete len:134 (+) Transcript_90315:52-453(+)
MAGDVAPATDPGVKHWAGVRWWMLAWLMMVAFMAVAKQCSMAAAPERLSPSCDGTGMGTTCCRLLDAAVIFLDVYFGSSGAARADAAAALAALTANWENEASLAAAGTVWSKPQMCSKGFMWELAPMSRAEAR